jgi:hypothetical protein
MTQQEFDELLMEPVIDIEVCKKWKNFKPSRQNFRSTLKHDNWDLLELLFSKVIISDLAPSYIVSQEYFMTCGLRHAAEFCKPRSIRWCLDHGANIHEDLEGDMLRDVFNGCVTTKHFDIGDLQRLVEKSLKLLLSQNKRWKAESFPIPDYILVCKVYKKMIAKRLSPFFVHSLSTIIGDMLCNDWHTSF